MSDDRLYSEACARNRDPILAALCEVLPSRGLVVEVASGTGMHAAWFSAHLPELVWQPTDPEPACVRSVAAWFEGAGNVRPPLLWDVRAPCPVAAADALFCANMVHISPWETTPALFAAAAAMLPPGAPIVLYGPFRRAGVPTAPSNEDFDASLRARDPAWGLRALQDVDAVAVGFARERVVELPANNVVVVWRRLDG